MDDETYKAFMDLMMCSDPWPCSLDSHDALQIFADKQALARGFNDWTEAYHAMGR